MKSHSNNPEINAIAERISKMTHYEIALMWGITIEQLCKQYAANLEGLKLMHERALKSKTGKYRGYTVSELEKQIEVYTDKSNYEKHKTSK